jgi:hypothetical protein
MGENMSGIKRWYFGSADTPPAEPLALDLITCVYNGDATEIDGGGTGGAACCYNDDGLEAWGQLPGSVLGYDFTTPFIAPGGTALSNGNSLSLASVIGMKFRHDGLRCLVVRAGVVEIYTFVTAFLWSTATVSSSNTDTATSLAGTISWNGLRLYTIDTANNLTPWDLGAAWDVTTLTPTGDTIELATAGNGIDVSRDQSRFYVSAPNSPSVVQEFIAATPGDPSTIPVDGFGVADPNYVLNVAAVIPVIADLNVSYDQTHLLISGAFLTVSLASYNGDAIF